jgi:ATP citrate (pro-S)-lyase
LVCKPDQLIKRRGKAGLLGINKDWKEVKEWISARMLKEQNVEGVVGELNTFLVEPFCKHAQEDEHYLCIQVK